MQTINLMEKSRVDVMLFEKIEARYHSDNQKMLEFFLANHCRVSL